MVLLLLSLIFGSGIFAADAGWKELKGTGGACHDGDTCHVQINGRIAKVRFYGIDAPEISQKYGPQARDFTRSLVQGKKLILQCRGASFERIVCTLYQGRKNINAEIVKYGWAFDFPVFSKGKYQPLEEAAHEKEIGIWRDDQRLISPYCYRHQEAKICKTDRLFMP